MKIVINEKKARRNARIGQICSIVGLVILGGGMYVSFQRPDQITLAWSALLFGFLLSQVGIYYGNRWGRRPRPDEHLDTALKGLDDRYTLYHYSSPVSHLLIGPAGIWVLLPHHQKGRIVYEKDRWRQKGGGALQAYLRIFAQEGLGRPDLEIEGEIEAMQSFLKKKLPEATLPDPQAALAFTNELAEIDVDDAPAPTILIRKLKDLIRKTAKGKPLSPQKAEMIKDLLENS